MKSRTAVTILACAATFLCILTSSSPYPGFYIDFRNIPVLIALLYGGYVPGILALLTLFVTRYFLFGGGFYLMIFFQVLTFILAVFLFRSYHKRTRLWKFLLTTFYLFICIFMLIFISAYEHLIDREFIRFFIIFLVTLVMAVWLVIYTIENMIHVTRLHVEKKQKEELLKSLGEMAASVAHEVRNPIMVTRGFLQLLQEEKSLPASKKQYVAISIQELDRSQEIINEYLSLARSQMINKQKIEIKKLVQEVTESMTPFAWTKRINIEAHIEDNLVLFSDSNKLKQVLINLIKNGIEAIPQEGIIKINSYVRDNQLIMEVTDNGTGMDQEQVKNIATPFFTTKENGTGLGLAVCYRIVGALNGKIEVGSAKGKGTWFRLLFPYD